MNVLLVYYTFTGQAESAVKIAAEVCNAAGHATTVCQIDFENPALRLKRPMSPAQVRRWTVAASKGETFPLQLEPNDVMHRSWDFIGIFSNTWQNHPAPPVRSLLALPEMQSCLVNTPFAIYVICRRLWKNNQQIVQREAEAVGGICLGAEHFEHNGGPVGSLLRTVSYLMSAGDAVARIGGIRLPLPVYGLSGAALSRVASFTRDMICAADIRGQERRSA